MNKKEQNPLCPIFVTQQIFERCKENNCALWSFDYSGSTLVGYCAFRLIAESLSIIAKEKWEAV